MVGIVSYGFYIPKYRIKVEDIALQWGKDPKVVSASLGVSEKTVSGLDEDSLTMAYEASSDALSTVSVDKDKIKVVYVGSETHPYVVNPTSTILADLLGIEGQYLASDTEFACKAATGAIIASCGLIESGFTELALVAASDKAQASPHDALEYTTSSGSASLVLGKKDTLVDIVDYTSYSTDTPDFWRREGIRYPSHGGRFTGKPSYFYHIQKASKLLLERTKLKPSDFSHAVFHMPNGKFPQRVGSQLGFSASQLKQGLIVRELGNSYTASALMGLVSVLDVAREGELIFFCSFGSGAGSDAYVFRVTKNLKKGRKNLAETVKDKKYIDYAKYLKFMGIV